MRTAALPRQQGRNLLFSFVEQGIGQYYAQVSRKVFRFERPGRKTASLHVTRETTMPAVLLEGGFLSNKADEAVLFTESFQNNVAKGIVAGIKEYLGNLIRDNPYAEEAELE